MLRNLFFTLALGAFTTTAAHAQSCVTYDAYPDIPGDLIVQYITGIDQFDHFNSSGKRLNDARQVIQQDRANVHKFGRTGPEDGWDGYFTSLERRKQISSADLVTWCHDSPNGIARAVTGGFGIFQIYFYRGYDGRLKLLVSPVG